MTMSATIPKTTADILTLNTIPYNCKYGSCAYEVIRTPHSKYTSGNDGITNMIDTATTRVEEHGDRTDSLACKDDKNSLPPV